MAKTNRGSNDPNENRDVNPGSGEVRKVNKSDLPEIILFDDTENNVERKEFSKQHAIDLVAYQHKKGYKNWTISPGQNLDVKDGKIVSAGPSGNAEA